MAATLRELAVYDDYDVDSQAIKTRTKCVMQPRNQCKDNGHQASDGNHYLGRRGVQ
jgi:hypothetical protein